MVQVGVSGVSNAIWQWTASYVVAFKMSSLEDLLAKNGAPPDYANDGKVVYDNPLVAR